MQKCIELFSRAGHNEIQPHRFAASWTTGRKGAPSKGGQFYNASYGIQVEPSTNTLVIWPPQNIHGTSLQDRVIDGEDPNFSQMGLAIVTSNRLPSIWQKYRANLLTQKSAEQELENGNDEDSDKDEEMED